MPDLHFFPALRWLAFCFPALLFSQNTTFQKSFASGLTDDGFGVTELPDGFLIAGRTQASDSSFSDALLIRTDPDGQIVWQRTYGGYGYDEFQVARAANDGGIIAYGTTASSGPGPDNAWLVKLDDDGNVVWQKVLGEPGRRTFGINEILPLDDGYLLSAYRVTNTAATTRAVLTRVDNAGETVWSTMPYKNRYSFLRLQFVQDSLLYVCGEGMGDDFSVYGIWAAVHTGTGAVEKSFSYRGPERENLRSMRPTADGQLILSGWSSRAGQNFTPSSLGWVQKVSPEGGIIWSKVYETDNWLHHWPELEAGSDGNFLLNFQLQIVRTANGPVYERAAVLVTLDGEGNLIRNRRYGSSYSHFSQVRRSSDGGWVAVGSKDSGLQTPSDVILARIDTAGEVSACCLPVQEFTVVDFDDTLGIYLPDPAAFAPMVPDTNLMVREVALDAADICGFPQASIQDTLRFCPGAGVILGDSTYTLPGVVQVSLPGGGQACDTAATYVLEYLPQAVLNDTLRFCPGGSVVVGDSTYSEPGTIQIYLPDHEGGCDTAATYVLEYLPQPVLNDTIRFCPGDTVVLHGGMYTQPAVISFLIPATAPDCDTLATYVLENQAAAQPAAVTIVCPGNIALVAPAGNTALTVNYSEPVAASDCLCPGTSVTLVSGGASGSDFPPGINTVCYRAEDACGNTASCCFDIAIAPETEPCDVKTIGCLRYELLEINRDADQNWFYHIRLTNDCATELSNAYFQVPSGVQALAPFNDFTYTSAGGRKYRVRNPNFSPFYSIRYKPLDQGLSGGQSDIFWYALPPQPAVLYIHVAARLKSGEYYEAHLNTFDCPVGDEILPRPAGQRGAPAGWPELNLYPNPLPASAAVLRVDGGDFRRAVFFLYDVTGKTAMQGRIIDNQVVLENASLPGGLYFFKIFNDDQFAGSGRLVVLD